MPDLEQRIDTIIELQKRLHNEISELASCHLVPTKVMDALQAITLLLDEVEPRKVKF